MKPLNIKSIPSLSGTTTEFSMLVKKDTLVPTLSPTLMVILQQNTSVIVVLNLDRPLDFLVQDVPITLDLTLAPSPALITPSPLCKKQLISTGKMEHFIMEIIILITHMPDPEMVVSFMITFLAELILSTTTVEAHIAPEETMDRTLTTGVTVITAMATNNLKTHTTKILSTQTHAHHAVCRTKVSALTSIAHI